MRFCRVIDSLQLTATTTQGGHAGDWKGTAKTALWSFDFPPTMPVKFPKGVHGDQALPCAPHPSPIAEASPSAGFGGLDALPMRRDRAGFQNDRLPLRTLDEPTGWAWQGNFLKPTRTALAVIGAGRFGRAVSKELVRPVGPMCWLFDRASAPSMNSARWTRPSKAGCSTARKRRPCGPPECLTRDTGVIGHQ